MADNQGTVVLQIRGGVLISAHGQKVNLVVVDWDDLPESRDGIPVDFLIPAIHTMPIMKIEDLPEAISDEIDLMVTI